jgi:hypothetical protein
MRRTKRDGVGAVAQTKDPYMTMTTIWLDGTGGETRDVNYGVGDFVVNRITGKRGLVQRIYRKLNSVRIETLSGHEEDGAATSFELAPPGRTDAECLDWILRQADEFSCGVLQDQPGDGLYRVTGMDGQGEGRTAREALEAAIADEQRTTAVRRARMASAGSKGTP